MQLDFDHSSEILLSAIMLIEIKGGKQIIEVK